MILFQAVNDLEIQPGGPIEPRPDQMEALAAIREAREQGMPAALIEAATGWGKMVVAGLAAYDQIERHDVNGRMLFVTHRRPILKHAREIFGDILGEGVTHGRVWDRYSETERQMTYGSYQKLTRRVSGGARRRYERTDPRAYRLVISDESHHAAATTYEPLHDHFEPDIFLNFTATPHRHDGRDTLAITGPVIYRKTLQEALAEGLLTPVNYKLYSDELSRAGSLTHGFEVTTLNELNRTVFIPKRDEEIVDIIKKEAGDINNPRGIIYCSSIEHAERMAVLLSESLGVPVRPLHSGLNPKVHEQYESDFRSGAIPIVTVIDQFNEGADYPDLNLLVFLRATESEMIFLQQLGRGLRRSPGKDMVTVVDLAGSIQRINMILSLYESATELRRSQPAKSTVERHPPFDFNFSAEVKEIMDVIDAVNRRTAEKEKELEPWRKLVLPEPLKLRLKFEGEEYEESVELSPFATFCLEQLWESPTGSIDMKFLQQAHRHLLKKPASLRKIGDLLSDLEYGGMISRSAFVLGDHKGENLRLTALGVEKLAAEPGFRGTYQDAVRNVRRVLEEYCEEARRQNFPDAIALRGSNRRSFHLHDWSGSYHLVEPLNRTELRHTDITDEELDQLYAKWAELRRGSPSKQFISIEYIVARDVVEQPLKISEEMGGFKGVSVRRNLTPGELQALAEELQLYVVEPLNRDAKLASSST